MKKNLSFLSLLLALSTAFGMNQTVLAADDTPLYPLPDSSPDSSKKPVKPSTGEMATEPSSRGRESHSVQPTNKESDRIQQLEAARERLKKEEEKLKSRAEKSTRVVNLEDSGPYEDTLLRACVEELVLQEGKFLAQIQSLDVPFDGEHTVYENTPRDSKAFPKECFSQLAKRIARLIQENLGLSAEPTPKECGRHIFRVLSEIAESRVGAVGALVEIREAILLSNDVLFAEEDGISREAWKSNIFMRRIFKGAGLEMKDLFHELEKAFEAKSRSLRNQRALVAR